MPITFSCECGQSITVKDEYAGKQGKCPSCKKSVHVPDKSAKKAGKPSPAKAAAPLSKAKRGLAKLGKKKQAAGAADDQEDDEGDEEEAPAPARPSPAKTPAPAQKGAQARGPGSTVVRPTAPLPPKPSPLPPPPQTPLPLPRPGSVGAPKTAVTPRLQVVNGPAGVTGHEFPILPGKPTVVGRDPEADISIPSERISRRHCQLESLPDGMFVIMDLGSSNGTLVNQERIAGRKVLLGGEYVQIGDVLLRFSEV